MLVSIYRAALADRLVGNIPCTGIKLPKKEPRRVIPLTVDQVDALIDAIPERYKALLVFAAGTGCRQGECFGVTVDRIDWLRRQVTIDRQLLTLPGKPQVLAPPKTAASYRTLPLPSIVVDTLAAHVGRFPPGDMGLVFTNERDRPINRTRFSDAWRRAIDAAGVPQGTGFHGLRHFYASLLIRHGESVKVVQSRLGHASAAETLDTYSHLWPDSEDRTRSAVDEALSGWTNPVAPGASAGSA